MNEKVSVIVPAYNVENVVSRCLDSLVVQTYSNKEIIVIDDGSTDRTGAICDLYSKNNDCIKVLHQNNAGVSVARNTALDIATGEYIIFVDSDDTVGEEYIQELMEWSDFDFVTAGYNWQGPDLQWHARIFTEENVLVQNLKAFPSVYLGKYYFGSPWATLMKKELINEGNIRFKTDIHSGEDTLFIFEYLSYVSKLKILPFCSYNYYFFEGSLANSKHADYWKWKISVESKILDFFQPPNNYEKQSLIERNFDVLRDLLRDYSEQMTREELYSLYRESFFENCIAYKRESGTFQDHLLIFCMNHKNYHLYKSIMRIKSLVIRGKGYLKRKIPQYWRKSNVTVFS